MPTVPNLGRSTASGFLWLMLQSLSGRLTSFFSQLVLAKLLMPEAFGQIGLAMTVSTLVNACISFGVDDILLQRLRNIRLWVAPAFWASFGLAVAGMLAMLAAAPLAAYVYGSPALLGLIVVQSIALPLGALSTVPATKLRAEMNFRYLALYNGLETVGVQLASVILAALDFGAYSFVLPIPVAALVKIIVLWRKAPARLRVPIKPVQFRYILGNGSIVFASRIVIEAVNQGDYMVLGLLATESVVGVYYFAFRLAAQPIRMLAGNFGAVLFPALTQLRGDPARQEQAALQAARILAYTVTPVCFVQAAFASPVLHLMFGERWAGSIPLVQVLSLGLPGDAIAWIAGALLVARKEFWRDFVYLASFAVPFFAFVAMGAYLGSALGVAVAVALYYALVKPANSWLVFRHSMRAADFLHIYIWPSILAGIAIGAAYACSKLPGLDGALLAQVAVIAVLSPLAYLVLLRLLVPDVLREILNRFPVDAMLRRVAVRLFGRRAAEG